jgi:hypothetical protein
LSFLPGHYFPAFNRSATLTPFIAGPLALMRTVTAHKFTSLSPELI